MTSLPMPASCSQSLLPEPSHADEHETVYLETARRDPAPRDDEKFLLLAFRSFAEAAGSLERSYGLLREEVERLRRELEETNADLTASVEENRSIRAHLDRILEGLPCGVLVVSSQGEITRANPEARRLLESRVPPGESGLEAASSLPLPLRQLLERSETGAGWDHVSQPATEQEFDLGGNDGSVRWLAARCASISSNSTSGNSGASSVVILRDISERKRLEAAESKLRREQALAEMSAVLAHEIRNPLASLELFAGLLAESDLDGERQQWVQQVQAGLRTLAATVNNVLHFHSLPEPERAPLDLGQLLDWARNFFVPLALRGRITLSSQNRLHGVFLLADRHRLEQVFLNLVLNAVQAMPGGGWIEIGGHVATDGQSVVMRLADTGPGIAPEHLLRIFEAGFSTRSQSPGLGLAVCRKIVEQIGGIIQAESRPGRGAVFTLTFPLTLSRMHVGVGTRLGTQLSTQQGTSHAEG